jgi:hypothetical protein
MVDGVVGQRHRGVPAPVEDLQRLWPSSDFATSPPAGFVATGRPKPCLSGAVGASVGLGGAG